MQHFHEYRKLIIIGIIVIVFGFYWTDLRPQSIRSKCAKRVDVTGEHYIIRDANYQMCIRAYGLEGENA